MVKILDGTLEQRKIQTALQDGTKTLLNTYNIQPKLAVILVGNHAPSLLYVEKKQAFAKGVGIETVLFHLSSGASLEEALALIKALNQDKGVHGILLQLPTPSSIDSKCLIETIDPLKDVDGLHPINMGKLIQGQEAFYPCTPQGCLHLIRQWKQNLGGLVAVVVGRSSLVGKPIATMLLKENATVIQAHSYTKNLKDITRLADSTKSFTDHCLKGLEIDKEKITLYVNRSLMLVTALNRKIGYDKAAHVAKKAYKENLSLKEAAVDLQYLTAEEFDEWVRVDQMIEPKE